MAVREIGIRKNVQFGELQYWFVINAKFLADSDEPVGIKEKTSKRGLWLNFIHSSTWKHFIVVTIMLNTYISIASISTWVNHYFFTFFIIVHLTCLFFLIDFLVACFQKLRASKEVEKFPRHKVILIIEGISLIPAALIYYYAFSKPEYSVFWLLRVVTLLRFYRIPYYFMKLAMTGKKRWKVSTVGYIFLLSICVFIFTNVNLEASRDQFGVIKYWNDTVTNKIVVSLYFSFATMLNVGYGDIVPQGLANRLSASIAMVVGFSLTTGVLTGVLATEIANMEKNREIYRHDNEALTDNLKKRGVPRDTLDKVAETLRSLWKYKKGLLSQPQVDMLPVSLRKEIFFDINFGLLNRSLIFSTQPRAFLRNVSLLIINQSFLPGDIIVEPFGMMESMLCVASGVIEILSEENDETPLFSLTAGSILGEAALYMSLPIRCMIRASTYVELQMLSRVKFARLTSKYEAITRAMRTQINTRLTLREDSLFDETNMMQILNPDIQDLTRRKGTKRYINELKNYKKKRMRDQDEKVNLKSAIMGLYVWSENIPRAKTLPVYLVKKKPWILRPDTPLMELWNFFIVVTVMIVVLYYPFLVGFVRIISEPTRNFMWIVDMAYLVDVYLQCTTALPNKDNFSYSTSIKEIIGFKLKTVGFYLDVIATFNLATYADYVWPTHIDYAYAILSQNRVLKVWQVPVYFIKLEGRMNLNILLVRTIKFIFYFCLAVDWAAVILYLEACPVDVCVEGRWYHFLEQKALEYADPNPTTDWPGVVSLYWACITISGLGYGDITAQTVSDCLVVILSMIIGTAVVTLCLAQASSTFKYLERTRTDFQEEVFAVNRFMREHEIPKEVYTKVRNYFQLQWNYDQGFSLNNKMVSNKLPTQHAHIVLTEIIKAFWTVPLFRKTGNEFLKYLAKASRVQVLPAKEYITVAGSFNRAMYILENGYCEVSTRRNPRKLQDKKIIGPLNAFGFIEMALGTPFELTVQTVTHVRIICLDYVAYLRAMTNLPHVKAEIEEMIEENYVNVRRRGYDTLSFKTFEESEIDEATLIHQKKMLSKPFINVYAYQKTMNHNYWEPFRAWGKFRIFQFLVMPFVVAPYSTFIKFWMALRIVGVSVLGLIVPINFSVPFNTDGLTYIILFLQGLFYLDMWLMFHVAYYDERGILLFHPAKTATWYLKGNFAIDLITLFPYYQIVKSTYSPDKIGGPDLLLDAPGMVMVFQFYKFFQGCYYLEKNILRRTEYIKILKFVPLALIVSNLTSGLLIQHECYRRLSEEIVLKKKKALGTEFQESLQYFCRPNNATVSLEDYVQVSRMYVTTFYWVTSTVTGCGFGDIAADDKFTMIVIMLIVVIGIFLYGYMFANLTSSMVSMHNLVTKYRRRMREMKKFIKKKGVDMGLQRRLIMHYEYNWLRTEGASPQKMFNCVHETLRESIVASMYEETFRQVPAFVDMEESVIRVIGNYLDEIYFLRGETIVKFQDIQVYIYLIYRGQVEVISDNGKPITKMGCGGMFGNITKTPFYLSSVTVVAARNTDLLRMDSAIFFKALQVFPNVKPLIDFLTSRTVEYIEPIKESSRDLNETRVRLSQIDTIPYELTVMKDTLTPEMVFSSLEIRAGDKLLHFKNSIFKIPHRGHATWVILPFSVLYRIIGFLVFAFAYLSISLTVYTFAFQDFSINTAVLSYMLDLLFILKIALEFHISFFNKHGEYVVNRKKIKKKYIQSKKMLFDIASNLPLEVFAGLLPESWIFPSLTFFRLNRLFRVYYVFEFFELKFKMLMINKIYLELSWIVVWISLMCHVFACIWYFADCPIGACKKRGWIVQLSIQNHPKWSAYLSSLYFVITLITTTGYGDVPIITSEAMAAATSFMIISRFSLVLLAGAMAALISVHSSNWYLFQERVSEILGSLKKQNLSEYQMEKTWTYLTLLWQQESGKQMPKFIKQAPYVMKCEVMKAMFGRHIFQCYVFAQMQDGFLRQLCTFLQRFVYFAGNYLVQQGDTDQTMYFIHKGQVSVLTIYPDLMETIHFTLMEDDCFGMSQGVLMGKAHHFSYRAETETEVISLKYDHWQPLLNYFPEAIKIIQERLETLSKLESTGISEVDI